MDLLSKDLVHRIVNDYLNCCTQRIVSTLNRLFFSVCTKPCVKPEWATRCVQNFSQSFMVTCTAIHTRGPSWNRLLFRSKRERDRFIDVCKTHAKPRFLEGFQKEDDAGLRRPSYIWEMNAYNLYD